MHEKKHRIPTHVLYKIFIYVALIALAISIIVPVAWVFMASLKKNAEFIGADVNPWALPKQFYYQNFVVAFQDARMGDFFLNSFIVTALALALLLILALPASYVLARFKFRGKKFFNGAFNGRIVYQCQLHCSTDLFDAEFLEQGSACRFFPG